MNTYLKVLYDVMRAKRTLQSDFSRYNAFYIAEAASRGHISSVLSGSATNFWFLTKKGFELLEKEGYV